MLECTASWGGRVLVYVALLLFTCGRASPVQPDAQPLLPLPQLLGSSLLESALVNVSNLDEIIAGLKNPIVTQIGKDCSSRHK